MLLLFKGEVENWVGEGGGAGLPWGEDNVLEPGPGGGFPTVNVLDRCPQRFTAMWPISCYVSFSSIKQHVE